MRLEDRFGDYLLFQKLGSTPLGSTYRAGRLQARAIDRVVLLERFDGEEVDRPLLVAAAARRKSLIDRLAAPRFASALGLGAEDGIPYVAYDYLLGRTLRQTLDRATRRAEAPAAAYLLALVEQAAAGLVAAARLRLDDAPIRHGFLVPELLLLSAEGRIYPLAFTHGPGLLGQESLRRRFAPYLSPESRGGDGLLADDVYSLAAILFEALTGAPPDPDEATASQVDRALLTTAGVPLMPALQDLLKAGLAARAGRPTLERFHQSLRQLIDEIGDSPSQFQLAFFLHQLFRKEMEAEALEMQDEKATRFDPMALAPAPKPTAEPTAEPADALTVAAAGETPAPAGGVVALAPAARRVSLRPFWAGAALALAFAAGSAALLRSSGAAPDTGAAHAQTAAAARDTRLRLLVATGADELQQRLEAEYEPRLARLRDEVVAARAARLRPGPAVSRAARNRPAPSPPTVAVEPQTPTAAAVGPSVGASEAVAVAPVVGAEEALAPTGSGTLGLRPGAEPAAGADLVEEPPPSEQTAAAAEGDAAGSPAGAGVSAAPANQAAATVASGSPAGTATDSAAGGEAAPETGFVPPRLLTPPQPRYPAAAQRLRQTARVQIRVRIDAEGRVGETELISGPSGLGFAESAVEAAGRTRWEPARRGGEATSAWAVLTIDFRL